MGRATRAGPGAFVLAVVTASASAAAHAGGAGSPAVRFVMPAWVVWVLGALVVAVTFALVGAFLTERTPRMSPPPRGPPVAPVGGAHPVARIAQALGLAVALAVVATPWLPAGAVARADAVVWVLVWVALPLVAYLATNPWPAVSPLRLVASAMGPRLARGRWTYPTSLGAWPATVAFVALVGLEVWPGLAHTGAGLAALSAAYLVGGAVGIVAFGADAWLVRADPLERAFAWWGAFAPLHRTATGWRLRWPGAGLVERAADGPADVAFIVAFLYGVNFDAFLATGLGARTFELFAALGGPLSFALTLALGFALFTGAFALCARGIARAARAPEGPRALAARFAPSLVPIAVGYHLAHNLPYLVGAVGPLPEAGLAGGALVALQMVLVVAGHVTAVLVAHEQAFTGFPSRVQAIKSELPLTAVMVLYTLVGLWFVSQGHGGLAPGVAT